MRFEVFVGRRLLICLSLSIHLWFILLSTFPLVVSMLTGERRKDESIWAFTLSHLNPVGLEDTTVHDSIFQEDEVSIEATASTWNIHNGREKKGGGEGIWKLLLTLLPPIGQIALHRKQMNPQTPHTHTLIRYSVLALDTILPRPVSSVI